MNESFCLTANDFPVALAVVVALAWAQHQFVLLPPPAFFNDVKRLPGSPSDHELQSSPPARYSHLPGATKDRPGQCLAILFGPKDDGTYVVEFRTAGETLAISIPRTEAAVTRHFQERMPYVGFLCRM